MKVNIIGGGILGLCTAYYLQNEGCDVRLFDDSVIESGTSHGNMGYLCRSHFEPLANPHRLSEGLRMMFTPKSPFYIHPAPDPNLLRWLIKFLLACRQHTQKPKIDALQQLNHFSNDSYNDIENALGTFKISRKGLLMITAKTKVLEGLAAEKQMSEELGIPCQLLSKEDIQRIDPNLRTIAIGGIYFPNDSHVDPTTFMAAMKQHLIASGVTLIENQPVLALKTSGDKVTHVTTAGGDMPADKTVIAAGSWSAKLLATVRTNISMMPAKGYSITLPADNTTFTVPFLITDKSVAGTPLGANVRIGSTLEIGAHNNRVNPVRTAAIIDNLKAFMPDYRLPKIAAADFWYGYRPCSFDGLPFIGQANHYKNLYVNTGHGMLGVTQAAGSGRLLTEIMLKKKRSIAYAEFAVNR